MKRLILFSIVVLITVSCAPSEAEIQETVQAILAETYAAYPTPRQTTMPAHTPIQPTETAVPTATPTPPSPTPTEVQLEMSTDPAFPVAGFVDIGPGRTRAGGFAGETIQVRVDFMAASPFGRVSRMRVTRGCSADTDLEHADWEPFVDSKTYPVNVVLGWSGFYICVQFQDEYANLSPVYRDDISVEGFSRKPLVNPTDWYPQIQCLSEREVHPGPDEVVTGTTITFSWADKNHLPEGVFYKVFAYGGSDSFTGLAASGQTGETSISLQIEPEHAGEIGWYITLVDANGTLLDHGQCSSFSAGLLTVDPPVGIKAVIFRYQP